MKTASSAHGGTRFADLQQLVTLKLPTMRFIMREHSNNCNHAPTTHIGNNTGHEDIAVIGFAFKLPGDVDCVDSFWDVLQNRKNLMTPWPESRIKADSFVSGKRSKVGTSFHGIASKQKRKKKGEKKERR